MRRLLLICISLLFVTTAFATPDIDQPDAIGIRKSEGPYLNIFPDGSAAAGFGALRPCVAAPIGTFDFQQLLKTELNEALIIQNEKRTADPSYIAVGFVRNSSARMYHFDNRVLIDNLFERLERDGQVTSPSVFCPFNL